MLKWLKTYGSAIAAAMSVLAVALVFGVYKATVDDLVNRVEAIEKQPRILQQAADSRLVECARIARAAYGDGSRSGVDSNAETMLLRLGCDSRATAPQAGSTQ